MSLIFSALAEIDKQAQDGQAEYASMGVPAHPGNGRRTVIVSIVALLLVLVLCLAAYHFFGFGNDEQRQTQVVAASAPAIQAKPADQPPATAVVADSSPVSRPAAAPAEVPQAPPAMPAARADVVQDPPYAPASKREAPPENVAGSLPVRIVGGNTGIEPVTANPPPAAPATDTMPPELKVEQSPPPRPMDETPPQTQANADTAPPARQAEASQAKAGQVKPSQDEPVRSTVSTQDDAPMIGSNNYIKVGRQPEVAADKTVPRWVASFREAMAQGDHSKARVALGKLESALSPQSLTLLRMQAWYAVDSGDDGAARGVYSRLLQRLPDDINAGVNVALIDWRAGRQEQALQRINAMYTQHPDSDLVRRNWQVMHQQRR